MRVARASLTKVLLALAAIAYGFWLPFADVRPDDSTYFSILYMEETQFLRVGLALLSAAMFVWMLPVIVSGILGRAIVRLREGEIVVQLFRRKVIRLSEIAEVQDARSAIVVKDRAGNSARIPTGVLERSTEWHGRILRLLQPPPDTPAETEDRLP